MRLLKPKEVAKMLRISVHQLRRLRYNDIGPRYTVVGASFRYDEEDVLHYVKSNMKGESDGRIQTEVEGPKDQEVGAKRVLQLQIPLQKEGIQGSNRV